MNPIVADVIDFENAPETTPATLKTALDSLGFRALRVVCINLAGWWRRELLQTSRHPYLSLNTSYDWCRNLESTVAVTPPLREVVQLSSGRCCFADDLTPEEIAETNIYAREHSADSENIA